MIKKKVGNYSYTQHQIIKQCTQGNIYKGKHILTNEDVAIKVVKKSQIKNEYQIKALEQEIKIHMKLNSPNIIKFLDFCQTSSSFYIIIEFANEGTLQEILQKRISKNDSLSQKETIQYLFQILNGFTQILKYGVVHRNMGFKSIFSHNGSLKIGEFDYSKAFIRSGELMKSHVGIQSYMAPQISNYQPYSNKCDIWSLGMMTYQMVTLKLTSQKITPFKSLFSWYQTIQKGKLLFPQTLSQQIISFIDGCLKFEQKDRFSWNQVYLHPIFCGRFTKFVEELNDQQQKLSYLMSSLQQIFQKLKINLSQQIKRFTKQNFTTEEFKYLMDSLNIKISNEQKQLLINFLQRKGKIDIKQFDALMTQYQKKVLQKKYSLKLSIDLQKIHKLKELIRQKCKQNNLNIKQLTGNIIGQKQAICQGQFWKIISSIVPGISQQDMSNLFKDIFEVQQMDQISVQRFIEQMNRLIEDVQQMKDEFEQVKQSQILQNIQNN